jgi:hypothetical protein
MICWFNAPINLKALPSGVANEIFISAVVDTLILIACLRGDHWLLGYITASFFRANIAEPVVKAIYSVGCSTNGRWQWEFLFAEEIFLPTKSTPLHQTLTYQALNECDYTTISLLKIVKQNNLFMMTTSFFVMLVEECERLDIMEMVLSLTSKDVLNGSRHSNERVNGKSLN